MVNGAGKKSADRKLLRKGMALVPRGIRHNLIRSVVAIESQMAPELEVKIARSREELESAFSLLHQSYVRAGFMKPHESGLRLSKFHALPSTSTLIATWKGQVVGTVSVLRNSPMGFPLDAIFDTHRFKTKGNRIAEISALAVHEDFRGMRGAILFPLLKYLYHYCIRYFGVDYMLIAVNPKHADFYEALLFFENIQDGVIDNYNFAGGAPAVGRYLDLKVAYDKFAAAYLGRNRDKDLFSFFTRSIEPNLKFPDRGYFKISDPIMTPDLLDYFFRQRTDLFRQLSEKEKSLIHTLYSQEKYREILPPLAQEGSKFLHDKRFDVQCRAQIESAENAEIGIVKNVSEKGLCLVLPKDRELRGPLSLRIAVGEFAIAEVTASPRWRTRDGRWGLCIEKASSQWHSFLEYLENDLNRA